ncbi:biopolymer transporter ExbD [Temperatibacter marinus]|uniref:Biopolymer transporter ExbD n=1 Tax=Temperatibacter marinus TaxID=1456591 RepID=A0AA52EI11_9PROT|nr:biopolymer transporter ExbD [Temperatibacter marinus]WND02884.1 biopolymer transporter ExbD [Temperatibacter marinus]
MRKFAKNEDEAEVNMTPMLDIVFIMLIFFIVTASFVKESGIDVNKPPANNSPPPDNEQDDDKRAIAFIVDGSQQIRHDFKRVALGSVQAIIKKNSVERPKAPVVIQMMSGAQTGIAMEIYDVAQEIGIPREQIILMKK